MKKPLSSGISLWGLGILFAALAVLASCQKAEPGIDASDDPMSKSRSQSSPDGGAITELVELYKTGFTASFDILSLRGVSSPEPKYTWEINNNGSWNTYATGESLRGNEVYDAKYPFDQHITKFRRWVETPSGPAYSNECTVINYAVPENPLLGSNPEENAVKLGPYDSDFSESLLFNTQGKYFQDFDRLSFHGNDAFITLELTQNMLVQIITGATPMFVRLSVMTYDYMEYPYDGNSSNALYGTWETDYIPFPAFDKEHPGSEIISLDLNPGKYRIQVQGSKATNGGTVNALISISLRGFSNPEIPEL